MKSMFKNIARALVLAMLAITTAHALPGNGTSVGATQTILQGGSNSSTRWLSPYISTHKVWVQIPAGSTATTATYRLYLKGNAAGSTACSSADLTYPCYEVMVNQATNQGKWVQLILGATTQWKFGLKGFVSLNASNVSTSESVGVAVVSFENMLPALAIGQTYRGGIIFYLDSTKLHGLVAAPKDILNASGNSLTVQWYNGSYTTTSATSTAVGTGKANTAQIIASQGAGSYAAKLCDDLVIGVYSDWYLPSKEELNLMYTNIGQGAAAPLSNVGGFVSSYYWSSSEYDYYSAWSQYFNSGNQNNYGKNDTLYVRAVRAF
jgi:hypothetical protein